MSVPVRYTELLEMQAELERVRAELDAAKRERAEAQGLARVAQSQRDDYERLWIETRIKLEQPHAELVSRLADAFAEWPLPASVCSDPCVTEHACPHYRSGTNLLTVDEARQMFEYVLAKCTGVGGVRGTDAGSNFIRCEDALPLIEALSDALSGWRYIRATHGDLHGVGWDRVEAAGTKALAHAKTLGFDV